MGLAALNCWIEIIATVHFPGGVQMPLGAIFVLICMIGLNWPLRALRHRFSTATNRIAPFSPTELLAIYLMALFAALISTPGADNFFCHPRTQFVLLSKYFVACQSSNRIAGGPYW
jgi:hypothetical protein